MKELTIEEKAQRYDEALERARIYYSITDSVVDAEIIELIFPELKENKESDSERIREEIIDFIYDKTDTYELREKSNSWLAWLEKQGEQIDSSNKEYWRGYREGKQEILDKYAELGKQCEQKLAWSEEDDKKAERIIRLLQEAYDINCINGSIDWLKFLRDRVQSKVEWSEEDNLQLQAAIDICKSSGHTVTSDWLKNLKDRVQPQPKQEWSEEAQQIIKDAACFIFTCANTAETKEEEERLEELADKLQDLRPQNIWKPSELQIEALESATANCAYSEYVDCLKELIKQLKQL